MDVDVLKSEFISTVSHELRTPLTSIGGYVKLIQAGDAGPVTDTQQEFLSIILMNVTRLTHLIDDILDIDKLEAGQFEIKKEPQDLREIVRECRESLILSAHQKGLELRLKIPKEVPLILGDRGRLVQIFNNLLSNAIKYTPTGFVEISLETTPTGISAQIRDSGLGISSVEAALIFQKFYRTDSGLASKEKGIGLGLAITQGLVRAHGGTIRVESEPGKGSLFEVIFPVTAPTVDITSIAKESPQELAELVGAIREIENSQARKIPETIWIIDSNPDSRDDIQRMIECGDYGNYKVRTFESLESVPFVTEGEFAPLAVILNPNLQMDSSEGEIGKLDELRLKLRSTTPVLTVGDSVDSKDFWIALRNLTHTGDLSL